MSHHPFNLEHHFLTRRQLLSRVGMGMGSLALGQLAGFGTDKAQASASNSDGHSQLTV